MRLTLAGLLALAWAFVLMPVAAQADFVKYKPGALKEALQRGETVLVDYKASW